MAKIGGFHEKMKICSAKLGCRIIKHWLILRFILPDQPSFDCDAPLTTAWSCMACLALAGVYWGVQEGLAARNYEEGCSRIDGEELVMAADSESRMKRNAEGLGGFWRKPAVGWRAFGCFLKTKNI